jgi:hypothetical protein
MATISFIISYFVATDPDYAENAKKVNKYSRKFVVAGFIGTLLYTFLPTTEQAAVIYLVPKIVNNEQIQNITGDGLEVLQLHIKRYLEELKTANPKK